ncbi:zinc finger protein 391 [Ixodes scapularis]
MNGKRDAQSLELNVTTVSFLCSDCGNLFFTLADLDEHRRRTHQESDLGQVTKIDPQRKDEEYRCRFCTYCSDLPSDVARHETLHIRKVSAPGQQMPYRCQMCGKGFKLSSSLKTHQRTHTGERPYKCETCGYRFTVVSNLIRHRRTHTNDKPFTCDKCSKAYSRNEDLLAHGRTHCRAAV